MLDTRLQHALRSRSGYMLLSFQHGLGDLINFLPIYAQIRQRYRRWSFALALNFDMGLQNLLPPKAIFDVRDRSRWPRFDYMYRVRYPEPVNDTLSKPMVCAQEEFGLEPGSVVWSPIKLAPKRVINCDPRRVGVHFFGHTSPLKKSCSIDLAALLWQELLDAGYHPFEIQMQKPGQMVEILPGITPANSLRYQPVNLQVMVDFIHSCQWFVGIDSGPLYTALASIGSNRSIALELKNRVQNYAPCDITSVSIDGYQRGSLVKTLHDKEGNP